MSFLEDLTQNTYIEIRVICMIISVTILFYVSEFKFPDLNIYILDSILEYYLFNILFFGFAIIVVLNGMNFIDGTNGLAGFASIFQLFAIMYLSTEYDDYEIFTITLFSIIIILIFILFNFPFGKNFLRRPWSLFFRFLHRIFSNLFFGKYDNLISWNAVLLLFYPCFEILFSFIRKLFYEKKTPF